MNTRRDAVIVEVKTTKKIDDAITEVDETVREIDESLDAGLVRPSASGMIRAASGMIRDASGMIRDASGMIRDASRLVRDDKTAERFKELAEKVQELSGEAVRSVELEISRVTGCISKCLLPDIQGCPLTTKFVTRVTFFSFIIISRVLVCKAVQNLQNHNL
ncbi:MAG: hypothetical protein HXS48_03720 [Theionarchaea archaeon]|nr:hypothetical protein [Theionarchaea archaeon]